MIPNKLHQELFSVRDTKHHQFFSTFLLLFLVVIQPTSVHTQTTLNNFDCCAVKKVEGSENLGGTYYLVDVADDNILPDTCKDSCIYKKGEDDDRRFCFKSSETHQTECLAVDLEDSADNLETASSSSDGFSTTEEPTQLPTAGAFSEEHVEFKQIYLNVTSELSSLARHSCDLQSKFADLKRHRPRTFAGINSNDQWKDGKLRWNFISDNANPLGKFSKLKDDRIGLSESDVKTLMRAMRQIEENTCIRFVMDKDVTDEEEWLLIMREHKNGKCQHDHIKELMQKSPQYKKWFDAMSGDKCFSGAYAYMGAGKPTQLVIGEVDLDDGKQADVGLIAHELLHNLGFGHTQKREDAGDYITIAWKNIDKSGHDQFEPCSKGNKNKICPNYKTYGLPYDCASIMHYEDNLFLTTEASWDDKKAMYAKDPKTCDISKPHIRLSDGDVEIINRMYCRNEIQRYEVASPDYPKKYPNSIGEESKPHEQKISVAAGSVVELTFSVFNIEMDEKRPDQCPYDWLQLVDGNGTPLTEKMCGFKLPKKVKSKTNVMLVRFFSDSSEAGDGFRARWKRVKPADPAVDGNWGAWSTWSSCGNGRDGKSTCKKVKSRHCNQPAPANGGKSCEGEEKEEADCTASDLADEEENPRCVIQGAWSKWSDYSSCSSSCEKTRSRSCTNPAPVNDQDKCPGEASETSQCADGDCESKTSGTVTSPNFPLNYPVDKDVSYPLMVAEGSAIQLSFTSMDIEDSEQCWMHDIHEGRCHCDYVRVLDTDGSEILKACGNELPDQLTSSGNKMTIIFHSDHSETFKGFSADWKMVEPPAPVTSGEIASPNYPENYPDNLNQKEYTIRVAIGKKVELTIEDLEIELCADCNECDHLEIYDTPVGGSPSLLDTLCGSTKPASSYKSTSNILSLVFTTDPGVNKKGFKATWKEIS